MSYIKNKLDDEKGVIAQYEETIGFDTYIDLLLRDIENIKYDLEQVNERNKRIEEENEHLKNTIKNIMSVILK